MAKQNKASCPIPLTQLAENYRVAYGQYGKIFRKLRILDAADKGKLWQAINAKFPKYQILTDTNWVNYVKSNLVASIYTVAKGASLLPTSDDDREAIEHINTALDYIWDINNVGYYQMQAGSSAALFNLGITQVGWDADAEGGHKDTYFKGNIVLKNISPLNYMRDPFAESLQDAAYVMTWCNLHRTAILGDSRYREGFLAYERAKQASSLMTAPVEPIRDVPESNASTDKDYYKVFTHFVKYNDDVGTVHICEVHTLNNEHILYYNPIIKPNRFPFEELFCNLPEGEVIGTSECLRILSNNIAYNIMESMMLTSCYKNQRPPRYVNGASGLNIATFSKHGNDPDKVFVVQGDATKAVHYHEFPQPTAVDQAAQAQLASDMQITSGIDGRYTGRDTGSVITTGGVEDMLNRVTLIDTPKINNYENYAKGLTQLILANFVEFSLKRTYFKKDAVHNTYDKFEVDYKELSNNTIFHYSINISSELPKNKARIAAMANTLMEKQMQYAANGNNGPDLITAEEWLQLQDLPFKELMQKRMGIQRMADATAQFTEGLFDYAALIKNGTTPEDAVALVGENQAAAQRGFERPNEIPALDEAIPAAQVPMGAPTTPSLDNVGQFMADPSLLQGIANNPEGAVPSGDQNIDPEILAKLGTI